MAKTRDNLNTRALEKLFMVGVGQDAAAEDVEAVDNIFDSFAAYIEATDIYTISDEDDIDEAAYEFLADMLAWFAAPGFNKPRDNGVMQVAEFQLKRITASRPTYERQTAEHY